MPILPKAIAASLAIGLAVQLPAMSHETGVLALYDSTATQTERNSALLEEVGCRVWRTGTASVLGSMELGEIDRFLFAECDSGLLEREDVRSRLQSQFRVNGNGLVFEGHFVRKEAQFASYEIARSRGYLAKISRFNNLHATRMSEEDAIDLEGASRKEPWHSEARIRVRNAIGIQTPDEVGLIYYESKQAMSDMRDNSPDLVDAIGAFNDRHLIEAAYFYIEVDS